MVISWKVLTLSIPASFAGVPPTEGRGVGLTVVEGTVEGRAFVVRVVRLGWHLQVVVGLMYFEAVVAVDLGGVVWFLVVFVVVVVVVVVLSVSFAPVQETASRDETSIAPARQIENVDLIYFFITVPFIPSKRHILTQKSANYKDKLLISRLICRKAFLFALHTVKLEVSAL